MILSAVLVALILFLGIGFYNASKLQQINIKKTTLVNSNLETVFNKVAYLKEFPSWSPFYEADPQQKITIKGTDGQIGAQFHWNGNNGNDLGYQEIKELKPSEYIKMECDIQKPFKANPTFEYFFEKTNNGIKVTQDFNLKSGLIDAFFMWLFGAKKDMSKMNARGMELLKKSLEQ